MRSDGTHPRLQSCANCHHYGWQHRGDVCVACGCPGFEHPRYVVPRERGVGRPLAGRKVPAKLHLRDDR